MEIIVFLSIVIAVVAVLTSIVLVRRVKKQIAEMTDVLVDVKNGNGNRRILSATNELTAPLAYEINEIVVSYESRLSIVRQTEETNRQLMTSLSHDVRTPLTTLIGYLDAAHKGLVTGKDRDDYIETARRKAHDLKEYIDVLFDWFKLNSNEFALEIQSVEAAELTRNILIDWIPIFEDKQVDYDIDIPEQPVRVRLDIWSCVGYTVLLCFTLFKTGRAVLSARATRTLLSMCTVMSPRELLTLISGRRLKTSKNSSARL